MKQINNGFDSCYYIDEQGRVFDQAADRELIKGKDNTYTLKLVNGSRKRITQRKLYEIVFDQAFCIDDIEDLPGEQWKKIDDKGFYWISNLARVKSYKRQQAQLIQQHLNHNGYYKVWLKIGGSSITVFTHRLVAAAFCEKPQGVSEDLLEVHHIDGNKQNSISSNLQWLDRGEHRKIHYGLKKEKINGNTKSEEDHNRENK